MHVNKIAADVASTDALQRLQGSTAQQDPIDPVTPARGADDVQLSDAGLALAADGGTTPASSALDPSRTDPSRTDQIRSSILSGAYNSLGMADQVARAVIRSGDL